MSCIVVVCGLPAVGKTAFCKHVENYFHTFYRQTEISYQAVHFNYDRFMKIVPWEDANLYSDDILSEELNHLNLRCGETKHCKEFNWSAARRQIEDQVKDFIRKNISASHQASRFLSASSPTQYILLIDDNMFYKSMRHRYYKIARDFRLGFGQIFLDTDEIDHLVFLNSQRSHFEDLFVTEATIRKMATIFEKPTISKYHSWEENSLLVQKNTRNQTFSSLSSLSSSFLRHFSRSHPEEFSNPIKSLPDDSHLWEFITEFFLFLCKNPIEFSFAEEPSSLFPASSSANPIHFLDLSLRKMIFNHVQNLSGASHNRQQIALHLNQQRKLFLARFRGDSIYDSHFVDQKIAEFRQQLCLEGNT
eukprot:Sdes_comp18728_c0_seq1m9066